MERLKNRPVSFHLIVEDEGYVPTIKIGKHSKFLKVVTCSFERLTVFSDPRKMLKKHPAGKSLFKGREREKSAAISGKQRFLLPVEVIVSCRSGLQELVVQSGMQTKLKIHNSQLARIEI